MKKFTFKDEFHTVTIHNLSVLGLDVTYENEEEDGYYCIVWIFTSREAYAFYLWALSEGRDTLAESVHDRFNFKKHILTPDI